MSPRHRRAPAGSGTRLRREQRQGSSRRWSTATVVAALLAALWTASPAQGQTALAEVVPTRVFAGWLVYRDYTRIDQLVVWSAVPGSHFDIFCQWGIPSQDRPRRCPGANESPVTVTVPPSGFVDLTRRFRRVRLEPGENITFLFDEGHGTGVQDQYPVLTKQVEFRARRGAIPRRDRGCILFTGPNAGPDLPCVAPCPPEPRLQFSTYCEGAGQLLPPPRFAIASRAARGGGVRLTHLEVGDLAFPPPFSDPAIAVFCNGRGCPFGARFFARPPGGVQRIESFGRSVLRPGTVIEIWIVKGNFIGRAQRYEVNRGGLAASSLCIHPTELTPRACPTG